MRPVHQAVRPGAPAAQYRQHHQPASHSHCLEKQCSSHALHCSCCLVSDSLLLCAQAILEFGEYVYNDKENQDDAVTKSLVSLLGDLASNVTGCGPVFAQKPYVQSIIQEARASGEASTAEAADWALGVISKAVTAQQ